MPTRFTKTRKHRARH
ncbi:hypothetical protein JL09_g6012 [Pichia kudriavzevii]|uniref:Uncharacterized protein n=1 Tax=Pichia kudriavzevii TaxID=4909 RepID=A0A099NS36_PICKU|nr:hypothetical protein JL09_g6012 [Pichia kudriavzevii]